LTIGLVGAHRTGKTTLARLYAEREQVQFVETTTSSIFKELGFDPKVDYDFKTRLFIQRKILDDMDKKYCSATGIFIADRTPLDALTYTLADVTRENINGELAKELEVYSHDCFRVLNRHFNILMLVSPGIPLVEAEGKAPANTAYIEHFHNLALGLLVGEYVEANHYFIPRAMTDLETRYDALAAAVNRIQERHEIAMNSGEVMLHWADKLEIK
jgi:predicted ATPase